MIKTLQVCKSLHGAGSPLGLTSLVTSANRRQCAPSPSLTPMGVMLSALLGRSRAGASMDSALDVPSKTVSTRHEVDKGNMMDGTSCEVFGSRTFADVMREVEYRTLNRFWGYRQHVEDAVSVAAITLLEYWIPRLATEDGTRNFSFAVRYGCFRASTHILNTIDAESHFIPLEDEAGNYLPALERLVDPYPGPEELVCSNELVRNVRELMDELDWERCLTTESTRAEAKRTGVNQMKVVRQRKRARNCMLDAYRKAGGGAS